VKGHLKYVKLLAEVRTTSRRMSELKTGKNATTLLVDWRRKMPKKRGRSCQSQNKRSVGHCRWLV